MSLRQTLLAAALAFTPAMGLAQNAEEATTVAPITVRPEPGRGASDLSPAELSVAIEGARAQAWDAASAARACEVPLAAAGPLPEAMGEFGIGVLAATESRTGQDMEKAARAALAATTAAGEGASADVQRAREAAVRAFLDARRKAEEARRRSLDLMELASERVNGELYGLRALEKGDFVPGCLYEQNGDLRNDVHQPDICYAPGESMRQFQGDVDYRSQQRASGSGGVYTPAEYRDLRLRDVVARQDEKDGVTVLRITGGIVNPRPHAITAPGLWIEVADRFGTPLKSEQIIAPMGRTKIRAGGTLRFSYAMSALPQAATRTAVTFAPLHRQTPYLVPGMACPIDAKTRERF